MTKARYFRRQPEVWDTAKCERMAKHTAKDGMGTKYHFKGYIGNHYGKVRYNGGCVRQDQWYEGEIIPLPQIAPGFRLIRRPTWGWQILKEGTPTMWTVCYKGHYIHGYCNKDTVKVDGKEYKSLHAAKCCITRAKRTPK